MGKRINLRLTHRLLYRTYLVKGLTATLIGAATIIAPGRMFGGPIHTLIGDYIPINVFGVLWLISGICIVGGLVAHRYMVSRMGMAFLISLFATTSVSMLMEQVFGIVPSNMLGTAAIYMSLALSSLMILLEPPVNPQTAIKTKMEK